MFTKETAKETIEKYEWVCTKRVIFTFLLVVMTVLPGVGYVLDKGFVAPSIEEVLYFPINLGAYALTGLIGAALVLALLCTVIAFVPLITSFGIILGLILTVLLFVLLALLLVLGSGSVVIANTSLPFEFSVFGVLISSEMPVPGFSETLGMALLSSLLFFVPYILVWVACMRSRKSCKELKVPAQQAQTFLEEEELRAADAKERQKQARKEQKERDRRAREEWERHKRHQAWEERQAKVSDEFDFFDGCTTLEQLDTRYKGLMRAYHPDTGSGDLEICQKINSQYQKLKDKFKDKKDDENE